LKGAFPPDRRSLLRKRGIRHILRDVGRRCLGGALEAQTQPLVIRQGDGISRPIPKALLPKVKGFAAVAPPKGNVPQLLTDKGAGCGVAFAPQKATPSGHGRFPLPQASVILGLLVSKLAGKPLACKQPHQAHPP